MYLSAARLFRVLLMLMIDSAFSPQSVSVASGQAYDRERTAKLVQDQFGVVP